MPQHGRSLCEVKAMSLKTRFECECRLGNKQHQTKWRNDKTIYIYELYRYIRGPGWAFKGFKGLQGINSRSEFQWILVGFSSYSQRREPTEPCPNTPWADAHPTHPLPASQLPHMGWWRLMAVACPVGAGGAEKGQASRSQSQALSKEPLAKGSSWVELYRTCYRTSLICQCARSTRPISASTNTLSLSVSLPSDSSYFQFKIFWGKAWHLMLDC